MAMSCFLLCRDYAQDFYMLFSADVFLGFMGELAWGFET